jgi:hypothetical protein
VIEVPSDGNEAIRLDVNLNADAARVLTAIAQRNGLSLTETVRRAIVLLRLVDQVQSEGHKLQLVNGSRVQDVRFNW